MKIKIMIAIMIHTSAHSYIPVSLYLYPYPCLCPYPYMPVWRIPLQSKSPGTIYSHLFLSWEGKWTKS